MIIKFIYSEKTTKFCEIYALSYVVPVKSKVEISQNFVAFSEYMKFTKPLHKVQICSFVVWNIIDFLWIIYNLRFVFFFGMNA